MIKLPCLSRAGGRAAKSWSSCGPAISASRWLSLTAVLVLLVPAALRAAAPVESGKPFTIPGLGITMMPIPAGSFLRGSPDDEPGRYPNESPRATVTISRPFWLSQVTVTHAQWKKLMGTDLLEQVRKALADDTLFTLAFRTLPLRDHWGLKRDSNPGERIKNTGDNLPMHYITWAEAKEFCRKLNEQGYREGTIPAGYEYTLPTEAQWEYACRAGTTTTTYAGPMVLISELRAPVLDDIAWYGSTAEFPVSERDQYPGGSQGPHDVGQKKPNAWGLYDMQGNVYQWCSDWYGLYDEGDAVDPHGPATGTRRVDRGGCWNSTAVHCRSARRSGHEPAVRSNAVGIRLALNPIQR